jgi:hypothetical protein
MIVFALSLLVNGCGTTVHTLSKDQADKARAEVASKPKVILTNSRGVQLGNNNFENNIHEHPVYDMPVTQVWPIVRKTLSTFCDGNLQKNDESTFHLEAKNQNVWEGDTLVIVNLKPDHQRTIVEVSVRDYGINRNLLASRSPHILNLFLERLNFAMNKMKPAQPDATARLQMLDNLKQKGLITDEEYRQKRAAIISGL